MTNKEKTIKALLKWGYTEEEESPIDHILSKEIASNDLIGTVYVVKVYVPKEDRGDTFLFSAMNKKTGIKEMWLKEIPKYPFPTTARWLSRQLVTLMSRLVTYQGGHA